MKFSSAWFALAVLALGACAPPTATPVSGPGSDTAAASTATSTPASPAASAPPAPAALAAVRVIIEFRQAAPYRSEAFVAELAHAAQARVRYLASVSDDTHVYELVLPTGLALTRTLERLNALPIVKRTEVDPMLTRPPLPKQ